MLSWANQFNIFCFLDSCGYELHPVRYECLLGAGSVKSINSGTLQDLDAFLDQDNWLFGYLSYSLGHSLHQQASPKEDPVGFPLFHFFEPAFLLFICNGELTVKADDPDAVYKAINDTKIHEGSRPRIHAKGRLSRSAYLEKIRQLQQHILRGDCYEVNFCQEFYSQGVEADPLQLYLDLTSISPNPFSVFYRLNDQHLVCASPERFLLKQGASIWSQPIKGTITRDQQDSENDLRLKQLLSESQKDQAENVMIVDLVRNDLSRICMDGTVKVDELFGIYAYPQVYQMISTITGKLKAHVRFSEIIRATFPMGSMTGAPKHRVMELIEQYEGSTRGIFSGTVGYIAPGGDFDFNVVIRSLMYNASSQYLSYQVGSGITFYSEAEKEWEECLLKAEAIKKVLTGGSAL
jgi:para-aminobenzoate synthetase component 1